MGCRFFKDGVFVCANGHCDISFDDAPSAWEIAEQRGITLSLLIRVRHWWLQIKPGYVFFFILSCALCVQCRICMFIQKRCSTDWATQWFGGTWIVKFMFGISFVCSMRKECFCLLGNRACDVCFLGSALCVSLLLFHKVPCSSLILRNAWGCLVARSC